MVLIGLWLNRDREVRVPYEMATKLSVPGLNPQAAVRYRGLDVGKVDEIAFDPQVPGQILVHISVKPDTPITFSTYGTLGYQGVTGIAYIQLDDDGIGQERVVSNKNRIARIEMRPSLLDNLQSKGLQILQQTEELTKRFNTLLEAGNQKNHADGLHRCQPRRQRNRSDPQAIAADANPTAGHRKAGTTVAGVAQHAVERCQRLERESEHADHLVAGAAGTDRADRRDGRQCRQRCIAAH
ncbi:MlaD family protein [Undibacterium arcticum]